MKRTLLAALASAGSVFVYVPMVSHACSVCLTGPGDPMADAFNASVLFLMVMPYVVVGSIVGGLIFMYRRAVKRRDKTEEVQRMIHLTWNEEESGR